MRRRNWRSGRTWARRGMGARLRAAEVVADSSRGGSLQRLKIMVSKLFRSGLVRLGARAER